MKLFKAGLLSVVTASLVYGQSLEEKVNILTAEIANLKESSSSNNDKVSIGGYGKMDYIKSLDKDNSDKIDIYRAIFYVGYKFNEDVSFVSEIEFEHGGTENTGGYAVVEQAYIDMNMQENLNLYIGHMIVPVGVVNVYHEPTTFNAVNRPEVEKYIIPSTWHENGVLVKGISGDIVYQMGIFAGLNASKSGDIRGMRQKGQKAEADDFAFVGRVDYKGAGFNVGASIFTGNAGQGHTGLENVSTTISEVHASTNIKGLELKALYAKNSVDNAQDVATTIEEDATGSGSGYYVNAAYKIDKVTPFVRYEAYNKNEEKYEAITGNKLDADADVTNFVIGINYNVTPQVVLKADYMIRDNKGVDDNRIELGTGYVF